MTHHGRRPTKERQQRQLRADHRGWRPACLPASRGTAAARPPSRRRSRAGHGQAGRKPPLAGGESLHRELGDELLVRRHVFAAKRHGVEPEEEVEEARVEEHGERPHRRAVLAGEQAVDVDVVEVDASLGIGAGAQSVAEPRYPQLRPVMEPEALGPAERIPALGVHLARLAAAQDRLVLAQVGGDAREGLDPRPRDQLHLAVRRAR